MPLNMTGLKQVGEIYQDLTQPDAPAVVVLGGIAYLIDSRTLHGRILKWNVQTFSLTEEGMKP